MIPPRSKRTDGRGNPTKYKPEYCEEIIALAKAGRTFEAIACEWGVHVDTFSIWSKAHPEFKEAKRMAKQWMLVRWQKYGKMLTLGKLGKFANVTAWIFHMKCVHGWNDQGNDDQDEEYDLEFD